MKTLTPTRFQYNLSLLNGGSTTVRVEQKVNGVYQYLATQQTQTTSGTYELSFVPNYEDIRISVSGTSRYALNNLYLDRDQIDTLVGTYALSRGYRYGFNGMEKDDEAKGKGNSYDFGARLYDSRLGRWLTIDPLAAKYPSLSPYNFVNNMPIVAIDPDGRDIIILTYPLKRPAHHRVGHMAMLIQNHDDQGGWTFYSKDYDGSQSLPDGRPNDQYTIKHFATLQDFADSEYNTYKPDYDDGEGTKYSERDEDGYLLQRFTRAFRISTSKDTDDIMHPVAKAVTKKAYNLLTSNCTHNVRDALRAGGLVDGENRTIYEFTFLGEKNEIFERNYRPDAKFNAIMQNNIGYRVDSILKPSSKKKDIPKSREK